MTHVCYLWKSLWVTLIAIGFVLVFKAQLSGAKFYVVAELRAPTTDLCDLGLSVDPGTVFVSLYFAQVLRESCLCFRYGRRICKRRCGSGTDTAWREGKKSHSYAYDSGTATACTRTSTFQDELAGGRTRFAWRGNCTLCLYTTPAPKAASGCGSMPGSPTGQQEVFSTAQMTQIAQIVSLSLNQAMGEFNMRLNGLQQQVVHQQNVFAQAQVQQAASQPAQVPVAKTSPSISSGLSSFGDRPPTSPQPNFPRNTVEQPPGLQQSPQRVISEVRQGQGTAQNTQGEASSQDDRDVFTKSEKWLPPLPKCEHGTWKTREQEILGFAGYVQSLRSWVALASDTFGWELESALSWPHELHMTNLKPAQQLRSARLLAILTQAFAEYPRAHMILQAYSEGIGMDGSFQAVRGTSGFEALRLLAKEFSLRSRAEAAFSGLSSCPRRLRHRVALHRSVI